MLHTGLLQHAFALGSDEQAVCGFRPPVATGFDGRARVPQLALPGPANPQCSRCLRLLAVTATATAVPVDSHPEPDSRHELAEAGDDDALEAAVSIEADASHDAVEAAVEQEESESTRDDARGPRRSSVRKAGRITVPQGRRSVVIQVPARWHGAAITADVNGDADIRVQSVRVTDDGRVRITLNQRTSAPVELLLYLVSGPQRP